ncbi:SDR family NAD(P)-dependent oxidoreductase [Nocardia tengchongensis]|uniref:SDR family NAD(P)-dependent oxidoreductase n=1 Tax=Nocardia tengchongensis TaxID=2055889 RepID=UPI0036C40BA0
MRLRGKVVIVTGGTRGLGRSIAESALAEGAKVVCAARSAGELELIREFGGDRVHFEATDVRDPAAVEDLMAAAVRHFGRLDVLVCNAGMSNDGMVAAIDPGRWAEVIETNLIGTFYCVRAAVPYLRGSGGGRIIAISSALSTRVSPGASAYCASKAGIEMLVRSAAAELAADGITVNAVAPGFVDTGLGARLSENDLVWEQVSGRLLAGRSGTGDEVGRSVVFLASDDASYVNSHILEVNGGLLWS